MYYACKTISIISLKLLLSVEMSICVFYLWHISFILRISMYVNKCILHGRLTGRKVFMLGVCSVTLGSINMSHGVQLNLRERLNPTEQSPEGMVKLRLIFT